MEPRPIAEASAAHEPSDHAQRAKQAFFRDAFASIEIDGTPLERYARHFESYHPFAPHPWRQAYHERFGGTASDWARDLTASLLTVADRGLDPDFAVRAERWIEYIHQTLFSTSKTPFQDLSPDEQLTAHEELRSRPLTRQDLAFPIGSTLVYELTTLTHPADACLERIREADRPGIASRRLMTLVSLARQALHGESYEGTQAFYDGVREALDLLRTDPDTNPLLALVAEAEARHLKAPRRTADISPSAGKNHPPLPPLIANDLPTNAARGAVAAIDPTTGLLDGLITSAAWEPVRAIAERLRPEDPEEGHALLQLIHHPDVRAFLEERLGFPITVLSLREQMALTDFLARSTPETCERAFRLLHAHGPLVGRTFLACERQRALGGLILDLAERAPEDATHALCARFCGLVDHLDRSADALALTIKDPRVRQSSAERIHHALLERATTLLSSYGTRLKQGSIDAEMAIDALERVSNDTQLLASLFKAASRRGATAPLEAFRDVCCELRRQPDLSPTERQRMQALLREQGFAKTSEPLFPEADRYDFFLLKHQDRLVGFIRFEDPDERGARHANFFCVAEAIRGSGIGEALAHEALAQAARGHDVRAEVSADAPVAALYIERFGFVGTGMEFEMVEGTPRHWLHLFRQQDDRMVRPMAASASLATIRRWADEASPSGIRAMRVEKTGTSRIDIAEICEQVWRMTPDARLTRYATDPEQRGVSYLVFESSSER